MAAGFEEMPSKLFAKRLVGRFGGIGFDDEGVPEISEANFFGLLLTPSPSCGLFAGLDAAFKDSTFLCFDWSIFSRRFFASSVCLVRNRLPADASDVQVIEYTGNLSPISI